MRTIFLAFLILVVAGITYASVLGLVHH